MSKLLKYLTILSFVFASLYITDRFRLNIGLSLTLNFALVILLFVAGAIKYRRESLKYDSSINLLLFFLGFLVLDFVIATYFSTNTLLGFKYLLKLIATLVFFAITYFTFRNYDIPKIQLKKGMEYLLYASSAILLFLIVINILIYKNNYITFEFESGSGVGKNQIQLYLSLLLPLSFFKLKARKNILFSSVFIIHLLSAFLVGARGLLVAIIVGAVLSLIIDNYLKIKLLVGASIKKVKLFFTLVSFAIVFVLVAFSMGEKLIEKLNKSITYSVEKLTELADATEGETKSNSINERKYFIDFGTKMFVKKPILGNGLGNFESTNKHKKLTHNDYLFF